MRTAPVPTCQHQMKEGSKCGRPALRRMRYCYFHQREHARDARKMAGRSRQRWFESVALGDAKSIQSALREIMQRLVSGEIEYHKAGQLMYKLQTAILNLRSGNKNEN